MLIEMYAALHQGQDYSIHQTSRPAWDVGCPAAQAWSWSLVYWGSWEQRHGTGDSRCLAPCRHALMDDPCERQQTCWDPGTTGFICYLPSPAGFFSVLGHLLLLRGQFTWTEQLENWALEKRSFSLIIIWHKNPLSLENWQCKRGDWHERYKRMNLLLILLNQMKTKAMFFSG